MEKQAKEAEKVKKEPMAEGARFVGALSVMVLALFVFNFGLQFYASSLMQAQAGQINALGSGAGVLSASSAEPGSLEALLAELIPKGVPAVYGPELGISFDDAVKGLAIIADLDGDLYPNGKIKLSDLTEQQKKRYINVGMRISCEYCCGATSLITGDGAVACGCAHSAGMRGIAKYLLKYHENEFTDEQILAELTKWKTMFFPKQMIQKAIQLQSEGKGIDPSVLNQIPEMVGGC